MSLVILNETSKLIKVYMAWKINDAQNMQPHPNNFLNNNFYNNMWRI